MRRGIGYRGRCSEYGLRGNELRRDERGGDSSILYKERQYMYFYVHSNGLCKLENINIGARGYNSLCPSDLDSMVYSLYDDTSV